jgi:hypothetical protein
MAFDRSLSVNEEALIKRHAVKPLALDKFKFEISSWKRGLLFNQLLKPYSNINQENEIKLSRVPTALWLKLCHFLDIPSLIAFMMACKTTSNFIGNDRFMRNALFQAQENKKLLKVKKLF